MKIAGDEPGGFDPHNRLFVVRCALELIANAQEFAGEIVCNCWGFRFPFGLGGRRKAVTVLDIAQKWNMCGSTARKHIGRLKMAGLVIVERKYVFIGLPLAIKVLLLAEQVIFI